MPERLAKESSFKPVAEVVGSGPLKSLLVPYPSDGMIAWPVSPRVGNVKNNDPSLFEPVVLP